MGLPLSIGRPSMRVRTLSALASGLVTALAVVTVATAARAQPSAAPKPPRRGALSMASPTPPPTIDGYVVTVEVRATAPGFKAPGGAVPEAKAVADALQSQTTR